ncbi:MAG: transcriptional regulator, partial [Rhizobiales bacterium]|nr:transcriptional regulator [Hyphomicrobiales bacterium]
MSEREQDVTEDLPIIELTAEIVGAYVGHHNVATTDLPALIATVGRELAGLGRTPVEPAEDKPKPAVPIKRSVRDDDIVCLICGKPQKMLKRHLATQHDLTPDDYRATFGLNDDYPLVAPAYAAQRSALAKKIGLGKKPEPAKAAKARAPRRQRSGSRR